MYPAGLSQVSFHEPNGDEEINVVLKKRHSSRRDHIPSVCALPTFDLHLKDHDHYKFSSSTTPCDSDSLNGPSEGNFDGTPHQHLYQQFLTANRCRNQLMQEVNQQTSMILSLQRELSYYRSKTLQAATERERLKTAYRDDMSLLISVVDRLLSEQPSDNGKDTHTDVQRKAEKLRSTVASLENKENSESGAAWLMEALNLNCLHCTSRYTTSRKELNPSDDLGSGDGLSTQSTEENLKQLPEESLTMPTDYSVNFSDTPEYLLTEEFNEIVEVAQKDLNDFCHSLDFSFPVLSGNRSALELRIDAVQCHATNSQRYLFPDCLSWSCPSTPTPYSLGSVPRGSGSKRQCSSISTMTANTPRTMD
ncbi:hypothetical protein ADEAN_000868300 [Angomonas deanei]|uniref:Uncharacterized protein n=1 Tax=Angomonas deanei TaxID=59799 RepID=A0A7G2CSG3_9TRYP|nr:hypothetical protein ADEAN_000868300 [Angomonas deanei]